MLQKLHEKIKGWVAGVIIAAISATFVLWGVQYYLQSSGADTAVAKINGEKITLKQLTTYFQQAQHQYIMKTGQVLSDAQNLELKKYALQSLLLNRALLQSAQHAGFKMGTDQINAIITTMPQFQENDRFSPARYQQLLYANALTPYTLMAQLSDEFTARQLESGIRETAFVLPNEAQHDYVLTHQRRNFGYTIIPQTRFIHDAKVTQQMLAAYYAQHLDEFKSPEEVSIEYVVLSPQNIEAHIRVSDANIKKALLRQKVNAIFTQESDRLSDMAYTNPTTLKPAADALHLQLQTSPLFSKQGGTQGILAEPKVIAAAFSDEVLAQNNNSDPIELKEGGVIILRVKQHQPSRTLSLVEMTPPIRQILQQQMAQAQAASLAEKIAMTIGKNQAPNKVIAPYRLAWLQSTHVSRNNKVISKNIVTAAFALAKSNAVTSVALTNGDSAIVQLNTIKADNKQASIKNLQAIQQQLVSELGKIEYQLYARSVADQAKIKVMAAAHLNAGTN